MKARNEEGMALLTVLLLVAVMGALTAATLETISRSMHIASNSRIAMQSRYDALGIEALALERVKALVEASGGTLTLAGGWQGREFRVPTEDGATVAARVSDGGNCFNLNSVASGGDAATLIARPAGITQFIALMTSLGVPETDARQIAFRLADWVDADSVPLPLGGEDELYQVGEQPYRAANTLLAERSELRAVAGMTAEIYEVLRPWICALPTTTMSPININTLTPEQAPLLAMILPGRLRVDAAGALLAARPAQGWQDLLSFWYQPQLIALKPKSEEFEQPKLTTRYFNVEVEVVRDDAQFTQSGLIEVARGSAKVLQRRWTPDE